MSVPGQSGDQRGKQGAGQTLGAPVIAIDGPSGSGKGTIAECLARRLGWHVLDSGALYRCLGLAAHRRALDLDDGAAMGRLAAELAIRFDGDRVLLNDEDVSDAIRTAEAGPRASRVAVHAPVRGALLSWQRAAARRPGLIADGRDMGSTVFPDATLKIYLDASPEERARRRYKQLKEKGMDANLPALTRELRERDALDRNREQSPLTIADGAVVIDTTALSIDDVVAAVLAEARSVPALAAAVPPKTGLVAALH
ncbi:(d)CMP kinase [Thiohalocapsa marina]|uniref:Cytidylate kinase n=1 Tax=Thiohalocapsa marina TaxID=424902 RepID=A0A5M8FTB4_9GAMM|nr:(d)CMP kinase [Thiohalocapsa marina]KAA6187026.1 (d)CMP kinase [Thiohalocapsa marina]